MILHSWTDDVQSKNPASKYIRPMILVKCSTYRTPADAASAAVRAINSDNPTIFLRHFGEYTAGLPNCGSETLEDFIAGRHPSFDAWTRWASSFWAEYAALGGPQPGMVVLENERGYTWFRIGLNNIDRLNSIDRVISSSKFSKTLRSTYDRSILENVRNASSPGSEWVSEYSVYIQNLYYRKLYTAASSGYYTSGYVGNVFSNYGASKFSKGYTEINNWKIPKNTSSIGFGLNSPPLYMNINGVRGLTVSQYNSLVASGDEARAKDALVAGSKNAFRIALEVLNSMPKTKRVPWIAFPLYRGDGVVKFKTTSPTRAFLASLLTSGVKDAIYWASPHETAGERAELESILSEIHDEYGSGFVLNSSPQDTYPEYTNSIVFNNINFE